MGFKSTEFLDDRELIGTGFNQADLLGKQGGGICDALCMYWLKRCAKMNYSGALPQPTSSVFGGRIRNATSELQEALKARMKTNFNEIAKFRASLDTPQARTTDLNAKKAVGAVQQASAKLAKEGNQPPRGTPPGKVVKASLGNLPEYLEGRAHRALDARDASLEEYERALAAKYGLIVDESVDGKGSDPGKLASEFALTHPLVTISFFWDHKDFGHRMAAYRAHAFQEWGFVFFDPNLGCYLCERADGTRFLNEWAAGYGGISSWTVQSWRRQ